MLFKNKDDKIIDKQIFWNSIWGKYGTTSTKGSKEKRKVIDVKEKVNFKITKDMKRYEINFHFQGYGNFLRNKQEKLDSDQTEPRQLLFSQLHIG